MKKIILFAALALSYWQGRAQGSFVLTNNAIPIVSNASLSNNGEWGVISNGTVWSKASGVFTKLDTTCSLQGVSNNGAIVGKVEDRTLTLEKGSSYQTGAVLKNGQWYMVGFGGQDTNKATDVMTISGDGLYCGGVVYGPEIKFYNEEFPISWDLNNLTTDKTPAYTICGLNDTMSGGLIMSMSNDGSVMSGYEKLVGANGFRRPAYCLRGDSEFRLIPINKEDLGWDSVIIHKSGAIDYTSRVSADGRYIVSSIQINGISGGSPVDFYGIVRYDIVNNQMRYISEDGYTNLLIMGVTTGGDILLNNVTGTGPMSSSSPFYWSEGIGIVPLSNHLNSLGITIPDGVNLGKAWSVSANGRVFMGATTTAYVWVAMSPELNLAVVEKIPNQAATGVALDALVGVKLSAHNMYIEDMNKVEFTPNPGNIKCITYQDSLIFSHNTFHYGTTYNMIIKAGAIEGQTEDIAWQFTTETAPEITFTPVENVQGAPVNTAITAAFSKEIVLLDPSKITLEGENGLVSGSASLTGMLITFTPDAALEYSSYYTVIIGAGAISGISDEISWTFETEVDPNAPVVQNITPVKDAAGVAANAVVSITFDRTITIADTSKITISGITISGVTVTEDTVLTINHPDFANNTEYTVTLALGAVTDLDKTVSWSFTTAENSGIKNAEGKAVAQIYPNPSKGLFHVAVPEKATIKVSDLAGKMQGTYKAEANTIVNLTQSTGIYLIRIEMNGVISTHKVIVE